MLTLRVTVNTSTVKTIVPKVQFPNTCKTHDIATEPRPFSVEAQKQRWGRGSKQGAQGGVGGSDCYGRWTLGQAPGTRTTRRPLRYPEPCSATHTGDQSWDGDRHNLLLTAMSIEDTSHCTTCISGFLGNLLSFCFLATLIIISLQSPLQNAPVGTVHLVWFVGTSDYAHKEKQILYINPNDGNEWEGCLPKAVKV